MHRFWKIGRSRGTSAARIVVIATAVALILSPMPARTADRATGTLVPSGPAKAGVDVSRFNFAMHGTFEPFHVTTTRPVRDALNARLVAADTDVLVTATAAGPLALLTEQMAYHHIAQGRAGDQEWLVSFCVVCNTATRLVPKVNGMPTRFVTAGVYNGLMVMQDVATGTIWNHITGDALLGPAVGSSLGPPGNVLHTTVKQLVATAPDARIAISDRGYFAGGKRHGIVEGITLLGRNHGRPDARTALSDVFIATLGTEDARRPRMDLGLGVWWDGGSRYYPRDLIQRQGGALIDRINGRTLLVYIDPDSSTPTAMFVTATRARVTGSSVRLDSGTVKDGVLLDSGGRRVTSDRPQQVFTRWYGFALTFPGTAIYAPDRSS
jgi:hypothetical protein